MPTLRSLRWQHDQASRMMLRLINLIRAHRPGTDAYPIAFQMAEWISLLRSHLASEDEWFYPAMIGSRDGQVSATAAEFQSDMGHLAEQLEVFDRRWSSSAVIGARFGRFRAEAFGLFAAFDCRIAREDHTLYPLAEAKGIGELPSAA